MKDMERSVEALLSREGARIRDLTGAQLHLNGPSANDSYITKKKRKRDYEGYSNTRKGKVELQLTPLSIDIGLLKQPGGGTTRNDQYIGSLILPMITRASKVSENGLTLSPRLKDSVRKLGSPLEMRNPNLLPLQPKTQINILGNRNFSLVVESMPSSPIAGSSIGPQRNSVAAY